MILGLTVGVVFLAVALVVTWLSFRFQRRPDGAPRWPAALEPVYPPQHTFADELAAIGVEAGPVDEPECSCTGEYPVVEVEEPPAPAPAGQYRSRHAADEDLTEPSVRPWQRPTLHTEPTPFFSATAVHLNLSNTGSWMAAGRAELLEWLARDEEAAA
jgi:hypothetical protein